jgi:hypothetical protein
MFDSPVLPPDRVKPHSPPSCRCEGGPRFARMGDGLPVRRLSCGKLPPVSARLVTVRWEALSVFMGHSSIKVTFDLYGHLMPGTAAEAAALLDGFLRQEHQYAEWQVRAA